jgi:large subunit ribosomal protein L4
MKLQVQGGSAGIEVSDSNFAAAFNEPLVHQVLTAFRAAGRSGTKAQKTRAEVRGGGIKPWKQKGTGRARAGSTRGPIWVGGGRAFAAKPRDFSQKVNRKMYRSAMRAIVSELIRQDRLVVVDTLAVQHPKTRELADQLKKFDLQDVLIVVDTHDENLSLAARNLPMVEVIDAAAVNPLSLISFEKVLATSKAVRNLDQKLSEAKSS